MSRRRSLAMFIAQSVMAGLAAAFVIVLVRPELANLSRAGGRNTETHSYARAVSASAPAVVNIYTQGQLVELMTPRGSNIVRAAPTLGSGVIWSRSGYVVTNWHVVEYAGEIMVLLADGRVAGAVIVGDDKDTELALLKIDLPDLPTLELGRSEELLVGDVVLAIGNSYGLNETVTMGIVSAVGRSFGLANFENFIQTDAPINAGNSGGALVNTRGQLVGINTARIGDAEPGQGSPEALGFAIPVSLVRGVVDQLIEHGRVIRGYLGVVPAVRDLDAKETRAYGVQGAAVGIECVEGPAARAGLLTGDVLTHINGQRMRGAQQAMNLVAGMPPGTRVEITVARPGGPFTTQATLEERDPALDDSPCSAAREWR